jgi:hypothetical protein
MFSVVTMAKQNLEKFRRLWNQKKTEPVKTEISQDFANRPGAMDYAE